MMAPTTWLVGRETVKPSIVTWEFFAACRVLPTASRPSVVPENAIVFASPVSSPATCRRYWVPSLNTEALTRRPAPLIFAAMDSRVSVLSRAMEVAAAPATEMSRLPEAPSAVVEEFCPSEYERCSEAKRPTEI